MNDSYKMRAFVNESLELTSRCQDIGGCGYYLVRYNSKENQAPHQGIVESLQKKKGKRMAKAIDDER
jgi:hypothetical protein